MEILKQPESVRRVEGLFALANQLAVRLAKARGQVEKLTPRRRICYQSAALQQRLCIVLLLAGLLGLAPAIVLPPAVAGEVGAKSAPDEDLFTNGAIIEIAVVLTPENLALLRKEPRRKVPATVRAGGQVYRDVAVHLKGALGSFRNVDEKPGLVMNFHFFTPGQRFHGIRKLMLNNSVQDPSYLWEKLAGELFRASGVPAPRTSHALVTLNGRKLGLYVLKEGFSQDFLSLHFKETQGNLYDIN